MVPKLCSSSSQSPSTAGSSSRRTSARLQKLLDDEEARRRISPWEHTTALQKQQEDEDDQEEEDQKPPLRKKNKTTTTTTTTTIARKLKIKRNNNINNNKASASASLRPPSPPDPPQLPITDDADNAITAPAAVATTTTAHIHAAAAAPHPPPCRSDKTLVIQTIRNFNKHYLHFVQEEEKRCAEIESQRKIAKLSKSKESSAPIDDTKRPSKRPDLKAITKMKNTNTTLNPEKRLGPIPGIEVGHQFFSRAEMVIVGFHSHWLNGIDYIGITASKKYKGYTLPLAVAIVVSGQYEDDLDNCDDVIYTGQGGNDLLGNKRQIGDQVMERGNLALKNSIGQGTPVRVVRGHISRTSYVGKVYTYDGLYKVHEYWAEKGVSGFTVYKFRLKRLNGQPPLTTNQVQYTNGRIPTSVSEIRGLVCEDISGGLEDIPIPATNLVDNPPVAPTDYTYRKSMQVAKSVKLPKGATGCDCKGTCTDSKRCACARLNGSDFPYVHRDGGRLIEPKAIVFECGPNCGCGPSCVNRTSQRGIKYRLEVFRTPKKGWGVRSWDFIPSGAPVCEYIGVLMRTEETDSAHENFYLFDIDCFETMKGLDGREKRLGDVSLPTHLQRNNDNSSNNDPEFCIDASGTGNITRYINHSCQPNLFVQCVLSSHHDIRQARIVLFAADNIPPLQELSYDYAYGIDSVMGPDGQPRQIACYCGADDCRRRLL